MVQKEFYQSDEIINPYIALADLCINLVLILAFFVAAVTAVGRAGWEQVRYRDAQKAFREALEVNLPPNFRPTEYRWKNDPPGAQRWMFPERLLFKPGTADLTPSGRYVLLRFAHVLRQHKDKWRRVRIEGHTMPPRPGEPDNWELSCARAAMVARVFAGKGHIPSYFLAVAGRAGQNPLDKNKPNDPANERVEILVEYAQKAAFTPMHSP